MKNKLPGIYKGKVKQSQNQKQSVFNIFSKEPINNNEDIMNNNDIMNNKDVNHQIKDIFNSPKYVYKADVQIIDTDGNTLKKTIIGRTNNSLITIDDELIDVSKISKIDFLN